MVRRVTRLLVVVAAFLTFAAPAAATSFTNAADRIVVVNSDGTWVVYKTWDQTFGSCVQPGALVKFRPKAGYHQNQGHWVINDVDVNGRPDCSTLDHLNDSRFGGALSFGWHHARRDGCCDTAVPPHTTAGDKDSSHAWDIGGRDRFGVNGEWGVYDVTLDYGPYYSGPETHFGITVRYRDGWVAPVMEVRYQYEFYDGGADLQGGVRVWTHVTQRPGTGFPGNTTAMLSEPKFTFGIAPSASGGLEYNHITVLDQDNATARSQCNVNQLGDDSGDSCQVSSQALSNGATIVRYDDFQSGCTTTVHRCMYGAFRSYPGGAAPHASTTSLWASPNYGLWAWGLASNGRNCFGRYGQSASFIGSSCNPPVTENVGGCLNVESWQGVVKRWEIHRDIPSNYAQVLLTGWQGGNGAYDCPIATKQFGGEGETWSVYANFSYGPGLDQQR